MTLRRTWAVRDRGLIGSTHDSKKFADRVSKTRFRCCLSHSMRADSLRSATWRAIPFCLGLTTRCNSLTQVAGKIRQSYRTVLDRRNVRANSKVRIPSNAQQSTKTGGHRTKQDEQTERSEPEFVNGR